MTATTPVSTHKKPPPPTYVRHEANLGILRQLEDLLDLLGDGHLHGLVGGCPRPEGDTVLLGTHVDHGAADLLAILKLLADAGQDLVG